MLNSSFPLVLAYLDPGTGSIILQAILGALAAGWVFFRHILTRIRLRRPPADEDEGEVTSASSREAGGATSSE